MKPYSRKQTAFSLIELLVVIAVILLLARMLLPSLDKAKATGLQVKCASNLHQLGVAYATYANDYNMYPGHDCGSKGSMDWLRGNGGIPFSCSPKTNPDPARWSALGLYANPSDRPCRETAFWCPSDGHDNSYVTSYLMNGGLAIPPFSNSYTQVRPSQIKSQSATYLLFEEAESGSVNNDGCLWCCGGDRVSDRHNGGGNALFCDGHVKLVKKTIGDSDIINDNGMRYDGSQGDATVY